jgi:hypothetical protein
MVSSLPMQRKPVRDWLHGHEPFPLVFSGQWDVVSLPAGQQQVLDRIETSLEGCEPRLKSMFAIFTRLTRDDGAPRTESLRPEGRRLRWIRPDLGLPGRLRAVIAVPLLLGLVALLVFMSISNSAAQDCGAATTLRAIPAVAPACPSMPGSHGR